MKKKKESDKLEIAMEYFRFLCDKYDRGWLKYVNWDKFIADIKKSMFGEKEKQNGE